MVWLRLIWMHIPILFNDSKSILSNFPQEQPMIIESQKSQIVTENGLNQKHELNQLG